MDDLVSVIITTYCGSETLDRAIKSIMNQTYKKIEIIVVDDNNPQSKERELTKRIVNNLGLENLIYIQHKKNMNGAVARNTGINRAKGKYIAFLDDDDLYMPSRIEESVNILRNNEKYSAVFCNVAILKNGKILKIINSGNKKLTQRNILIDEMSIGTGSNIFIRKNIIEKLGGFDESFIRHQDLEFLIRFFENYEGIGINEILVIKGVNSNSNIPEYNKFLKTKIQYFEKFKAQIDRLDYNEKKDFYFYHYSILLESAIENGNLEKIKRMIEEIENYGVLTRRQKALILLSKIKLYKTPVYNFFHKILIIKLLKKDNVSNDEIDCTQNKVNKYLGDLLGCD